MQIQAADLSTQPDSDNFGLFHKLLLIVFDCGARRTSPLNRFFRFSFFSLFSRPEPELLTFKGPRIDSKEPISPGCVAWRACTTSFFLLGS